MYFPDCSAVIRDAPGLVAGSPRLVVGAPRLVAGVPRLIAGTPRCFLVHPKFPLVLRGVPKLITITPMVLLYQSSEILVTPKAGRNALLGSDTLLKLMHLSLHSTVTWILNPNNQYKIY